MSLFKIHIKMSNFTPLFKINTVVVYVVDDEFSQLASKATIMVSCCFNTCKLNLGEKLRDVFTYYLSVYLTRHTMLNGMPFLSIYSSTVIAHNLVKRDFHVKTVQEIRRDVWRRVKWRIVSVIASFLDNLKMTSMRSVFQFIFCPIFGFLLWKCRRDMRASIQVKFDEASKVSFSLLKYWQ